MAALVGCLASGSRPGCWKRCSEGAGCNKRGKTCEKFRQMKMHSEFSVPLPPSSLIVGHVDCVQAEGSGGGGSTGG